MYFLGQLCRFFERLSQSYHLLHGVPEYQQVLLTMKQNITCIKSDREAVKLARVKSVEEKWDTKIITLYADSKRIYICLEGLRSGKRSLVQNAWQHVKLKNAICEILCRTHDIPR